MGGEIPASRGCRREGVAGPLSRLAGISHPRRQRDCGGSAQATGTQ